MDTATNQEDTMPTPDERLQAFADKMGTTVAAIKAHTAKVERALWAAKQAGATDTELIAIATQR